jgi:hypothetical protein
MLIKSGNMGEGAAQNTAQTGAAETPGAQIETGAGGSGSAVSGVNNGALEKELDNGGQTADTAPPPVAGSGAEWVEGALGKAGEVLAAVPVDAPNTVLPLFRAFRDRLIEAGGGVEYAVTPGDHPPATFQAPKKKAVDNTVEARSGWKASVISRLKPLQESIPLEAGRPIFDAFEEFKKAVQAAKPGAREIID